jgi:Icc-related predicted phosphoesterase
MSKVARLVLLSDTHGLHDEIVVPEGDVLVHAGDFTIAGTFDEVRRFDRFLAGQPHRSKVVIAGNHDRSFEKEPRQARALIKSALYLEDQAATVAGIRFYGSPWQPWFLDWAFNLPRGDALRIKWAMIPDDTDVLITHGPPRGILDRTLSGEAVGCADLLARIEAIRPPLHVFGHIHEGAGIREESPTTFVNASTCTAGYEPKNPPIIVDFDVERRAVVRAAPAF